MASESDAWQMSEDHFHFIHGQLDPIEEARLALDEYRENFHATKGAGRLYDALLRLAAVHTNVQSVLDEAWSYLEESTVYPVSGDLRAILKKLRS
jgi:hypothetical protein